MTERRDERGKKPKAMKPQPRRYVADLPAEEVASGDPGVRRAVTDSGLPVEEQVRKEWDPNKKGGLPTFLRAFLRTGAR